MRWFWLVASVLFVTGQARAADHKTLRRLQAPPPVIVTPLPTDVASSPTRLSKVLLQPREGEGWALIYAASPLYSEGNPRPRDEILPWNDAPSGVDTATFSRIFDEELRAAGFSTAGQQSLFEERAATDLQVGVIVDDIKGRFCSDCPHMFQKDKVAAVVTMSARWEIYSTLRSEVMARVSSSTGATWRKAIQGSPTAVMFDAFRENVRVLLASDEFRQAVTAPPSARPPATLAPVRYVAAPPAKRTIASSTAAVAAIFTGDGHGSGFLISKDGYLLTNHHVVGGAKYVKVRWPDGSETVGEVVRTDRRRDIAIVKADPGARAPLALRAGALALGEPVYAVGTPLDAKFQGSVTKGVMSASRIYDGLPFIQSDVVINNGNSGGPLLDESGAVVGVCVAGWEINGAPVGINLFIPIDDALKALVLTPAT